jgi:topoisomerase-4 subunit B
VRPSLELWLNQHVDVGRKLAELVIRQAQTRQRAAQKVEKRKGSGVAVLPGKLTDCESRDLLFNEVFLVEGDSAGGSAKMGRDKETQAVLPLRGKVLNTWEVDRDRLFANTEIHDIAVAIGVDPHAADQTPDMSGSALWQGLHPLRRRRRRLAHPGAAADAVLPPLSQNSLKRGHLYIARPPLFRVDAPARGKKPAAKIYALDEGELEAALDKLRKEGAQGRQLDHQPLQGAGRDERRPAVGRPP